MGKQNLYLGLLVLGLLSVGTNPDAFGQTKAPNDATVSNPIAKAATANATPTATPLDPNTEVVAIPVIPGVADLNIDPATGLPKTKPAASAVVNGKNSTPTQSQTITPGGGGASGGVITQPSTPSTGKNSTPASSQTIQPANKPAEKPADKPTQATSVNTNHPGPAANTPATQKPQPAQGMPVTTTNPGSAGNANTPTQVDPVPAAAPSTNPGAVGSSGNGTAVQIPETNDVTTANGLHSVPSVGGVGGVSTHQGTDVPSVGKGDAGKKPVPMTGVSGANTGALDPVSNESPAFQAGTIVSLPREKMTKPGIQEKTLTGAKAISPVSSEESKKTAQEKELQAPTCEDQALAKIYDLLLADHENILALMFETTAMRLAKRALEQTPTASTLEEQASHQLKELNEKVEKMKTAGAIQDQVKQIYQNYGKSGDAALINQDLEAYQKQSKDACYWAQNQRLSNQSASAFVLAVSVGEKDSGVSELDAATIWVVERARAAAASKNPEYKIGKEKGNLLNMSTRVARYLGGIDDGLDESSKEKMQQSIDAAQARMSKALAGVYVSVKAEFRDCALAEAKKANTPFCEECFVKRLQTFETEHQDIAEIQKGLLKKVSAGEGLKVDQALKLKLGEVTYDFSNFAKVPKEQRRGKGEACVKKGASPKTVNRSPSTTAPGVGSPAGTVLPANRSRENGLE